MSAISPKRYAAVLLAALLIAAGCTSTSAPPPAASTAAASPSARSQAEEDCGQTVAPAVEIDDLALRAANGVTLNAAIVGSGPRGVILLHQTDDGMCGWLPYARYMATQGFHVGLFDFRCTFNSSCVEGENAYNVTADVSAMAAELRKRGARSLAVVGASYGGAVAIGSCATVKADACVALSPALYDNKLGGGMTANMAIGRLTVPLLFAAAPDDSDSPADQNQALLRRARPNVVTYVELPSGAGHGWETVADPDNPGQWSSLSDRLIDFISDNR